MDADAGQQQGREGRRGSEPSLASPESTGGAGEKFEVLVAVAYLVDLLLQRPTAGIRGIVTTVRFQGRYLKHLYDDVIVQTSDGEKSRLLDVQVKRSIKFTAADDETKDVLAQGLQAIARDEAAFRTGTRRLGVGVPAYANANAAREVAGLTEQARARPTAEEFYQFINTPVAARQGLRNRLAHLAGAKALVTHTPRHDTDPELRLWLRVLVILPFDLLGAAARRRADLVGDLAGLYEPRDPQRGENLFEALRAVAADLIPRAGAVNAETLTRELPADLTPGSTTSAPTSPVNGLAQGDALMRGPARALGSHRDLDEAERLRETHPAKAADLFGLVARTLEENGYPGHAVLLGRRQAAALRAAGRPEHALEVLLPLA